MKSIHISKMERSRSINLRIGFAAALFLTILAFNWTAERSAPATWIEEAYPDEVAIKPFTINRPSTPNQPPATVLRPKDIIVEVPNLAISMTPTTIPFDSPSLSMAVEPGNLSVQPAMPPKAPPTPTVEEEPEKEPFLILAEEMPRFPGCELGEMSKKQRSDCALSELLHFVNGQIRYPELARQNGIEGTVYIKFVVERDGSINQAQVVRDIGGGCGIEALRVVNLMPKWTPGKQRGRAVRVQFTLPVKFSLG